MNVSRIESAAVPEESYSREQLPPTAGWQHWLERFQAMCGDHNIAPGSLTADKRPFFAIITADHLHDDTIDYYSRLYGPKTQQTTAPRPVEIPRHPVHRQLYNYYLPYPPHPVGAPQDKELSANRLAHQNRYLQVAAEGRDRWREVRVAERLHTHFLLTGQAEAAEATGELLVSYGMVIETLHAFAYNVLHPPASAGTPYITEMPPHADRQDTYFAERPLPPDAEGPKTEA